MYHTYVPRGPQSNFGAPAYKHRCIVERAQEGSASMFILVVYFLRRQNLPDEKASRVVVRPAGRSSATPDSCFALETDADTYI